MGVDGQNFRILQRNLLSMARVISKKRNFDNLVRSIYHDGVRC